VCSAGNRPSSHRIYGRKAISSYPLRDYFSALVDERGMLKRAVADDGLHPNDAGYKIMASLVEKAIQKALAENRAR
jgi:lysophospholipase L1-like esterase